MIEKIVKLPGKQEMFQRLLKVSTQLRYQEQLYLKLLNNAGKDVNAETLVAWLVSAFDEFRNNQRNSQHQIKENLLYELADEFIDALVIDPEVANLAKKILKEKTLVET